MKQNTYITLINLIYICNKWNCELPDSDNSPDGTKNKNCQTLISLCIKDDKLGCFSFYACRSRFVLRLVLS